MSRGDIDDRFRLQLIEVQTSEIRHKVDIATGLRAHSMHVRSREDYDMLLRAQDEAHRIKEPAMIVALPVALDPAKKDKVVWRDEGGIASTGGLAIFNLRLATAEPLERLPVA